MKRLRALAKKALKRLWDPGSAHIWTPAIMADQQLLPRIDRRAPDPRR